MKTFSKNLCSLANHINQIYVTSKQAEYNGQPIPKASVVIDRETLAEWAKVINSDTLEKRVVPNKLYSSDKPEDADIWLSIMFNGGQLLAVLMKNNIDVYPQRSLYAESVEAAESSSKKPATQSIDFI